MVVCDKPLDGALACWAGLVCTGCSGRVTDWVGRLNPGVFVWF